MVAIKTQFWMEFVWYVIMFTTVYYYLRKVEKNETLPKLRIMPATLAIEEGVGRALEMGKPVHYSLGSDGAPIMSSSVGTTIAALAVLKYTTRLVAKYGTRMIMHLPSQGESIPMIEGVIREGYVEAGKPDSFQRGDMHYYGYLTAAFSPGVYTSFVREGVGLFMHAGSVITYEFPILEAAKINNAIVIGGTPRWTATYIFAMACDHMFIGEELLAAGAALSENKYLTSSIVSEELWKYIAVVLLVGGLILQWFVGIPFKGLAGL
ncbi:hypothetical protein FJY84_00470 [Candidatus Bathyarchaeota archaeon]|nr:hypothetical protein [Candidatus Bathyarchaeota archaeon]